MANVITSPGDELKKDLETNKKLKPKLRKFLINEQTKKAQQASIDKKKEDDFILSSDDVINRAGQLACIALLKDRIWQRIPPYLDWQWIKWPVNQTPQLADEMNKDIAGFATYLVREYNNFLKFRTMKYGYRNPMQEEHLEWFWVKFNKDLHLLIEAEKKRVLAGNKSDIVQFVNKPKQPKIFTGDN